MSIAPLAVRALVVALCAAVSLIVGILVRADGASLLSAAVAGGQAFAAALLLALAVAGVLEQGW